MMISRRSIAPFVSSWALLIFSSLIAAGSTKSILEYAEVSKESLEVTMSDQHADRKLLSTTQLESCLEDLVQLAGDDNEISTAEFLEFLTIFSGGMLHVSRFGDLPAQLVSAFIIGSCYQKVCPADVPPSVEIPTDLTSIGDTDLARLRLLCSDTQDYVTANPQVPYVPIEGFTFLIQHDTGLSASEIMSGKDNNTVVEDVTTNIQTVILESLNCSIPERRTRILDTYRVSKYTIPEPPKLSAAAIQAYQRKLITSPARSLQDCRYDVQVEVTNLIDNNVACNIDFDSVNPRCVLFVVSILVSTKSVEDTLEGYEISSIRKTAMDALDERFN